MHVALILAAFLISICGIRAQEKEKYLAVAGKIKTLFNEKRYNEIYGMLSTDLQKEMKEEPFVNFLKIEIYEATGKIEGLEYLSEQKDFHSIIMHHQLADLKMNILLDQADKIAMLQFLPYQAMPKTKILDYGSDNPSLSALDSAVNKTVRDYMQSPQNCGMSIGIIQDGKEYFYNYGEIFKASKKLPANNTIYEIGSMSKVFCGILLAQAVIEKKVNADDDIRKYLPPGNYPNLESDGHPVTLVQLSNHSSGLPRLPEDLQAQKDYDPLNPYKNYNREMVFSYLQKTKLKSQPGKVCEYSNLGMALLGIILEKVYNKKFEDLVKEKICQPLDMPNTVMNLDKSQAEFFAKGYNSSGKETPYWNLGDLCAAGGLRSSSKDMLNFLKKNIEEKNEALKLSHQATFTEGNTVGMAWHIMKTKQGNQLIWHNGGTFGFSSFMGFIKEKNCAVLVLSNSGMMVDPIALSILKFLQK